MAIHGKTRKKGRGKGNNGEEKFCGERSLNGQLILATQGVRESKTFSKQSACGKIKTGEHATAPSPCRTIVRE